MAIYRHSREGDISHSPRMTAVCLVWLWLCSIRIIAVGDVGEMSS
jgi:hypothetical protein